MTKRRRDKESRSKYKIKKIIERLSKETAFFLPILKYQLGGGPTVLRSMQALLRMEQVYYDYSPEGKKYYKINDLLFRRWVEGREL